MNSFSRIHALWQIIELAEQKLYVLTNQKNSSLATECFLEQKRPDILFPKIKP